MIQRLLYLFSLMCLLTLVSTAQADLAEWEAAIDAADPLHWYKFNEASGTDCIDSGSAGLNGVYNGVIVNQPGLFGLGTAVEFDRSGANLVDFAGATDLPGPWTVEYVVKTTKAPAGNDAQALHDGASTSVRLAGWTDLGEAGFTQYGVADYRFTPAAGLTLEDLIIPQDQWMHLVWRNDGAGGTQLFINGQVVGTSSDSIDLGRVRIGAHTGDMFQGLLDEAVVFDEALSDADIAAHAAVALSIKRASSPQPRNEAMLTATSAQLGWAPGARATSYDVYFGESFDEIDQATPESDAFLGNQTAVELEIVDLTPGATYYWRVDAINETDPESPWKGEVWSFWVQPDIAWAPTPADGVSYIDPDQDLTWEKGLGALFHTVFFGESFDEVNDAVDGGFMTAEAIYDPATLELGKTYYWRVDEFAATGTHKGQVWSFTTLPEIPVTDESLLAWWTLDEAEGTTVVDWSGHGHHGTLAGDAQWADGYFGSAMYFDGSGDSVNFGTPQDLYLSQNYTYTAWFQVGQNISGNSGAQYLLCVGSRSDLVFGVEDGVGVDGDLMLHYYDTDGTFHAVGVGKTNWSANEWHMVAGTRDATGHNIYLDGALVNSDTNTNEDNFGGATTRIISLGGRAWTGHQWYNGLIDDVRIYNRALDEAEIQQVMRGNPLLAGSPNPGPGATVDIRDAVALSWSAGDTAVSHDVYFGTDKDALELQGNQPGTSFSLAGLVEMGGGDYFWRIDEVAADGSVQTGYVWRFNIPDYLVVDDFESYTNEVGSRVFETWIDGIGFTLPEPGNPGNGTGAAVGHDIWSADSPYLDGQIMEIANVHGGGQAMPIYYDNTFAPARSEADRTFVPGQNWTVEDVTTLVVHFRGQIDNTGNLYVEINGVKVPYPGDPADIASTAWVTWEIDLASVGVSLTNVTSMTIGIEGGQAGLLFIDDILLTRP